VQELLQFLLVGVAALWFLEVEALLLSELVLVILVHALLHFAEDEKIVLVLKMVQTATPQPPTAHSLVRGAQCWDGLPVPEPAVTACAPRARPWLYALGSQCGSRSRPGLLQGPQIAEDAGPEVTTHAQ